MRFPASLQEAAMCTILSSAHASKRSRRQFISLNNVIYAWLAEAGPRATKSRHLFEMVDFLNELGEEKVADVLIRRLATSGARIESYGLLISESGREHEIRIFAHSWLRRMKGHATARHFIREVSVIYNWASPVMAEAVFVYLGKVYGVEKLGQVIVDLPSSGEDIDGPFGGRLIRAIAESGRVGEVIEYVQGFFTVPTADGCKTVITPALNKLLKALAQFGEFPERSK